MNLTRIITVITGITLSGCLNHDTRDCAPDNAACTDQATSLTNDQTSYPESDSRSETTELPPIGVPPIAVSVRAHIAHLASRASQVEIKKWTQSGKSGKIIDQYRLVRTIRSRAEIAAIASLLNVELPPQKIFVGPNGKSILASGFSVDASSGFQISFRHGNSIDLVVYVFSRDTVLVSLVQDTCFHVRSKEFDAFYKELQLTSH